MKSTSTVVLASLTLLTGACALSPHTAQLPARERKDLGVRATQWGALHEFEPVAPIARSRFVRGDHSNVPSGAATVELLIGADGKVRDAVVVESSGNPRVDEAARAAFVGEVFPRLPAQAGEAPYVARHRVVFNESRNIAMKEFVGWPASP